MMYTQFLHINSHYNLDGRTSKPAKTAHHQRACRCPRDNNNFRTVPNLTCMRIMTNAFRCICFTDMTSRFHESSDQIWPLASRKTTRKPTSIPHTNRPYNNTKRKHSGRSATRLTDAADAAAAVDDADSARHSAAATDDGRCLSVSSSTRSPKSTMSTPMTKSADKAAIPHVNDVFRMDYCNAPLSART